MPVVAVQSQECLASTSRLKMTTTMWLVLRCIYISSHRFVFFIFYLLLSTLLMIVYRRQPLDAQATSTHHHLYASPPASTRLTKKKKHPQHDTTWDGGMTGIASRFFIYITFFFLYYRWYLLLQLSQRQQLPFYLPVPSSPSQFGLWKVMMAKIGPNNARCIIWAFSKLFFFFFHVPLTLTIIFR